MKHGRFLPILFSIYLLAQFAVACAPTVSEPTVTNEPAPTETAVPTDTPIVPTETAVPATPTEIVETAVPDFTYIDENSGVTFTYPPDWQQLTIGNNIVLAADEAALMSNSPGSAGAVVYLLPNQMRKLDSIGVEPQLDSLAVMFAWGDSLVLRDDGAGMIIYEDWGWWTVGDAVNAAGDPVAVTIAFNFGQEGFGAIFVGIVPHVQQDDYVNTFAQMIASLELTAPAEQPVVQTSPFDPRVLVGELESEVVISSHLPDAGAVFWRFDGQREQLVTVSITPTVPHLDIALQLYDANGEPLWDVPTDNFFGQEERVDVPLPTDGDYYLGVQNVGAQGGAYDVHLAIAPPAVFAHYEQPISHPGIQFSADEILGRPIWFIPPDDEYTIATFTFTQPADDGNLSSFCRIDGCITFYDAQKYADAFEGFEHNVDLMQTAIANGQLGKFPTVGAAVLMQSQIRPLSFQNGTGFRGVVSRGQDGYWVNNESIVYDFHGLTDDGNYYVRVQIPIDWAYLIDSYDLESNSNEDAILPDNLVPDSPDGNRANMMAYNQALEPLLDVAPNAEFTPDLSLLDALVQSILIDITD